MFDPKGAVKATRPVSMRELSRSAGMLIDEIEQNGSIFVLSRHGRMVAVLAPLPERTVIEFTGTEWPEEIEQEAEIDLKWRDLDEIQRTIFREALDAHPMPFGIGGLPFPPSPLAIALGTLELRGLVERIGAGRKLTPKGLTAARWLDSGEAGRQ
jgi:antitoxin (DNA-binding transcriptional repressor) of toxin-antitoxin stability system